MKMPALVLAGSVAANLVLVAILVSKPDFAPAAVRPFLGSRAPAPTTPAAAPVRTAAVSHAPPAPRPPLWSRLSTTDYKALVAQLRAEGFPIWAIRAVVLTQLNRDYLRRMRQLSLPDPTLPYWKSDPIQLGLSSERSLELSRLMRDRVNVVKELLGDFASRDDGDSTSADRRRYGNLDRAKIDAVQRIESDYVEMTQQIRSAMRGVTLPEDRDKFALLEREKRADLASVLSPQELADYEVRNSPVTLRLRSQLTAFGASAEEFQAIYRINSAFADVLYPTTPAGGFGPAEAEARAAAQQQVNAQLKATLGEARYAEYVRSGDRDFQQFTNLAERDGLAPSVPIEAYNLRLRVAAESQRIADDASLSTDAKRAALQLLAQNARNQFTTTLGQNAATTYLRLANWLGSIERGAAVTFNENGGVSIRSINARPSSPGATSGGTLQLGGGPAPIR